MRLFSEAALMSMIMDYASACVDEALGDREPVEAVPGTEAFERVEHCLAVAKTRAKMVAQRLDIGQ